jgi:hypothetical protein
MREMTLDCQYPLPILSWPYGHGCFIREDYAHSQSGTRALRLGGSVAMFMSLLTCSTGSDQDELLLTRGTWRAVAALHHPCPRGHRN